MILKTQNLPIQWKPYWMEQQSKSGGQNEKLESATIEKQAPATNALESKELTESELHAEEMIKK